MKGVLFAPFDKNDSYIWWQMLTALLPITISTFTFSWANNYASSPTGILTDSAEDSEPIRRWPSSAASMHSSKCSISAGEASTRCWTLVLVKLK
jgi:hypothetical protein